MPNGSFESGKLDGWTGDGEVSEEDAHSGRWSVRVSNGKLWTEIPTQVGATYKVIGYIKVLSSEGVGWGGMRMYAIESRHKPDFGDHSENLGRSDWLHNKEWTKIALKFTATEPKTLVMVGLVSDPKKKMTALFDDFVAFRRDGPNQLPVIRPVLSPAAFNRCPGWQTFDLKGEDPDGVIRRVCWEFGDGMRSQEPSGGHRVGLPGNYTATVTAIDDEGAVMRQTIQWSAVDDRLPQVTVRTPATDDTIVDRPVVSVAGVCSGSIERVVISGDLTRVVQASGTNDWKADVPLSPGRNRLLIQAHDKEGRVFAAERMVRYVPSAALKIADLQCESKQVEQWDVVTVRFQLLNSAATQPYLPYDPAPAAGLAWVDGTTVDGVFTAADGKTYRRPCFIYQDYERDLKHRDSGPAWRAERAKYKKEPLDPNKSFQDMEQWVYPRGNPVWMVRFAPPTQGRWTGRIEVREAKGAAQSEPVEFQVVAPKQPANHGPVRVSTTDPRYFEYANGKVFLGSGHAWHLNDTRYLYDVLRKFEQIGRGNQQFFRWWLMGNLWGSSWWGWWSATMPHEGITPATGLSIDCAYGDGLASIHLRPGNPIMWQGFMTGHAGLVPDRDYCLRIRWRTVGIDKPEKEGEPFGACVKLMNNPSPGKTSKTPALVAHVHGDTPWHVAEGRFKATRDFLPGLAMIMENASEGAVFIDECALYEVRDDGTLGPQLLRTPYANAHFHYEPARGYCMDEVFKEALARDMYFKVVLSDKGEYLVHRTSQQGIPDRRDSHFNDLEGTPARRLHEYYWRHVFARFGAFRSVHSWETVNEDAPEFYQQYYLAAALATAAAADGNPHPATLSNWATLAEKSWKHPASAPISYVNFHAYVYARGTGWLEPKTELEEDTARAFAAYDRAASAPGFGKPIVWGEMGGSSRNTPDSRNKDVPQDTEGVWLHKIVWARCGSGGVYPLYWYTDNIYNHNLHHIYGEWNRFMEGIPLANGRYRDVEAKSSNADLRVLGQKDLQAGRAHLWLDNRHHTWKTVIDGKPIPAVSGTVSLDMGKPAAAFNLTWYDTSTGKPTSTVPVTADAAGRISVEVKDLNTDTALQLAPK